MTTLSTHVLDLERGIPAEGVPITLYHEDAYIAEASTDPNGRIAEFGAGPLGQGRYRLVFDVAAYLQAHGRAAPFVQRFTLEFQLDAQQPHYHVPLLMTPYACTSYRGS